MAGTDPPSTVQLIAAGWGYAMLNPGSVQADNGAGLTKGIIGLVNKGQPRKPDDWGALRAWGWGASRGLDYLETDHAVDATQRKPIGVWPSDADRAGAERQRLDDVRAAADAGVEQDRKSLCGFHDGGQAVDCRYAAVGLTAAVV